MSVYKNLTKWDFLKIINLYRMAGMNKTMLTVSNDKNLKLNFTKNGDLIYKGRIFSKVMNIQWNLFYILFHLFILNWKIDDIIYELDFFFRKVTVWTTKLNFAIKNKRYQKTWSWELLFTTRISMIKFEYSKKATKFEKKNTYLSQVFQLSSFCVFSTNQNAWQFCILIGRTHKKLESWWAGKLEMASVLVSMLFSSHIFW